MFRGWIIVAVAFVANFVSMGVVIQCMPVFLLPFVEEFGIGRTAAVLPPVVVMACGAVILPAVGRAVTIFPIRNLMIAGSIVLALGFYAMSAATAFWQVLLIYGLAGSFGLATLGIVSTNTLIVNWFDGKRSLALGVAMVGMSVSGVVIVPVASWVLEAWGWRAVCQLLAAMSLSVLPLVAACVVSRPSDVGLRPDGQDVREEPEGADGLVVAPAASTREIVTNPELWLIAAASGLVFFASMGIMNHGIAFAVDRGIDPLRASVLLSAIAFGAGVGKLVFGWLPGRIGEHGAFAVALVLQLVTLVAFLTGSGFAGLVLTSLVYGLGLGGISPLQASLLARGVGARNFGPAQGLIAPIQIPFQIAGPPLAGFLYDTRGSYDLAIMIFIGAIVVSGAALAALYAREPAAREVAAT